MKIALTDVQPFLEAILKDTTLSLTERLILSAVLSRLNFKVTRSVLYSSLGNRLTKDATLDSYTKGLIKKGYLCLIAENNKTFYSLVLEKFNVKLASSPDSSRTRLRDTTEVLSSLSVLDLRQSFYALKSSAQRQETVSKSPHDIRVLRQLVRKHDKQKLLTLMRHFWERGLFAHYSENATIEDFQRYLQTRTNS